MFVCLLFSIACLNCTTEYFFTVLASYKPAFTNETQLHDTRVIWKVLATAFYFENEARNSVNVYIFRYINIPSTNQSKDQLDIRHAARAEHSRVRSLLWQWPKIKGKKCVIWFKQYLFGNRDQIIQKYTLSCKTGSDSKRNAYMKVIY